MEHILVSVAGAPGVVVAAADVTDAFEESDAPLVELTPEEARKLELVAGTEVAFEDPRKDELVAANELTLEEVPRNDEPVAGAEVAATDEPRKVEPVAGVELTPAIAGSEAAASAATVRRRRAQRADNLELRMRAMAWRTTG